jgi:hypothetical protein
MQKTKENSGKYHWMNSKLKFHIDAENAFNLQDALLGVQNFGGVGQVNDSVNSGPKIIDRTIKEDDDGDQSLVGGSGAGVNENEGENSV